MENKKVLSRNNFSVFYHIFKNTILLSLRKISLHITGSIYLGISLIFASVFAFTSSDFQNGSLVPFANLYYIFSTFTLFIFVTIVMLYFFHTHKKIGLLKLEQREGVPLYISYIVRMLNTFLFVLIYQLVFIIITNAFFLSRTASREAFTSIFSLNVFNLLPVITFVVITVVALFIMSLNSIGATFFSVMIAIVYSVSPLASTSIVTIKHWDIASNNLQINSFVSNIKLGEKFYKTTKKYGDIYNSGNDYFKILNNIKNIEKDQISTKVTNIYDIYDSYNKDLMKIFLEGKIFPNDKMQKDIEVYLTQWNFYKNYLVQINKVSDDSFSEKDNSDYYNYFNTIFNNSNSNKEDVQGVDDYKIINKSKVISVYKNYLSNLINKLEKNNQKIISLIKFAKDNIDILVEVFESTMITGMDRGVVESAIPIIRENSKQFAFGTLGKKINYMKCQLNWELIVFYDLSLSPVLTKDRAPDYSKIIKENNSYKYFDLLIFTNHLYQMSNYKFDAETFIEMNNNNLSRSSIESKDILRPFRVSLFGDKKLEDILSRDGDSVVNPSNTYFNDKFNVKIKRNLNMVAMFFIYPLVSLGILVGLYYLFVLKSKK